MMKYCLSVFTVVMSLVAVSALAAEGHVGQATLANLGLGEMEIMSDEQGMEVRGKSGNAFAMGVSVVTGFLIDPSTKNFVGGTDAHSALATASNSGKHAPVLAMTAHESFIVLQLNIVINGAPFFNGFLLGNAGGNAMAWAP